MNAEFRWNFEAHDAEDHYAFAETSFRVAEDTIRHLVSILPPKKKGEAVRVLDAGAGGGHHSWQLAKHGYWVVASELGAENLASADAFFHTGINFKRIITDCSIFPFADSSFDAVFCKELAHHLEDLRWLFAEFGRGTLVLVEPCHARRPLMHSKPDAAIEAGLTHQDYGLKDYLSALNKEGFRVSEFKSYRKLINPDKYCFLHAVDAALVKVFCLRSWGRWNMLKQWRTNLLGGTIALLAKREEKVVKGNVCDRAIEVLSANRLGDLREAIEKTRRSVPAFLSLLEKIHIEKDFG